MATMNGQPVTNIPGQDGYVPPPSGNGTPAPGTPQVNSTNTPAPQNGPPVDESVGAPKPSYDPMGYLNDPNSENNIRAKYQDEIQKANVGIQNMYQSEYQAAKEAHDASIARSGATLTNRGATGLGTSSENTAASGIDKKLEQDNAAIDAKVQAAIQASNARLTGLQTSEVSAQRALVSGDQAKADKIRSDNAASATAEIQGFAKDPNMTLDALKKNGAWAKIVAGFGGDETKALSVYAGSKPESTLIDKVVSPDGQNVSFFYRKPDGSIETTHIKTDMPLSPNDEVKVAPDGSQVVYHWEGKPNASKLKSVELAPGTTKGEYAKPIVPKAGKTPSTQGQDMADAQAAIKAGANPADVRQRFLQHYPGKGASYDNFMGGKGPTTASQHALGKDILNYDDTKGTREQLVSQLHIKYPDIPQNDISSKVYAAWPDKSSKKGFLGF